MVLRGQPEGDGKGARAPGRSLKRWSPALAIALMLAGTGFVEWHKARSQRTTSPIHEQATNAASNPEPRQKSGAAPNSQGASDSKQNGSPPPAPAAGQAASGPPQEKPATEEPRRKDEQRGTEQAPLVVETIPAPKTNAEAAQEQADREDVSSANWWMVRLTGIIGIVGVLQLGVFGWQGWHLRATVNSMNTIAGGQTADMQAAIAQSARSAEAMERVAGSMAENVGHLRTTVGINREIADRQKLVTELQSRAYLSVAYAGIIPQNSATGFKFEPRVSLINNGLTPAYKVKFRTAADVLPHPLGPDFGFPLPDYLPTGSISVIGPRLNKILSAVVPKIYPDVEVEQLKMGIGQRIYIWGQVEYEDAFGIGRYVKFGQSIFWLTDGVNTMSTDTRQFNDAN